ncbi:MAG: signal recognition particle-docking protein FtsY [Clostridia bacterium]|nr:signal recognition particle-docking protein FtsY [Clostridia bacterium]
MGLFDSFKRGLNKTSEFFSKGFTRIAASSGKFDEDMLDELEELLVMADCGVDASSKIIDHVKAEIKRTGMDSKESVLGYVKSEMLGILGEKTTIELEPDKLNIIIMVGVNGTGKTTTCGKLALNWKKQGKKVILAAADTFRAAAVEQLKAWGESTDTTVISQEAGSDPAAVCYDAVHAAIARKANVLIIDTAGRLHNKTNLMNELTKIYRVINREAPDANVKSLLIIDATTGQNAILQAQAFGEAVSLDYIGITKLDGSSKGGVAVALRSNINSPIVLAGLGEAAEDLVDFDPELFVNSLIKE